MWDIWWCAIWDMGWLPYGTYVGCHVEHGGKLCGTLCGRYGGVPCGTWGWMTFLGAEENTGDLIHILISRDKFVLIFFN